MLVGIESVGEEKVVSTQRSAISLKALENLITVARYLLLGLIIKTGKRRDSLLPVRNFSKKGGRTEARPYKMLSFWLFRRFPIKFLSFISPMRLRRAVFK